MRQYIPNLFTLSNLFCGCCAVVLLLYGQPAEAAWFILGSFLFDYGDGMIARAMKTTSPLGGQLDSLADVVSFGVVPATMLYGLLASAYCPGGFMQFFEGAGATSGMPALCLAAAPAFLLAMFSAYRLAKFNLDTRQKSYFVGLSTPGCTLFVLGLTLAAYANQLGIGSFLAANAWILYGVVALFSYLLVAEIPMFALKFKGFGWHKNKLPYSFLALSLFLLFSLKGLGLSLVILVYILISAASRSTITNPRPDY